MAKRQTSASVALRLPPTTKAEMQALIDALNPRGEEPAREDLVGALITRAVAHVGNDRQLDALSRDARAHKARRRAEGML